MYKLSFASIMAVLKRNYMSFKKLFKLSIFPNLFDPFLFLLSIGLGLSNLVGYINDIAYMHFVAIGLVAATAMNTSTTEVTVNAFIQIKIEKTYYAIIMTPVNLQDIVIGQVIWAAMRSVIFGGMFLIIATIFGVVQNFMAILILPILFVVGFLFGLMGMIFTILSPNRDYINYYRVLLIQPIYMFSGIFFPIETMPEVIQRIAWFSPLYHAANLCRGLVFGDFSNFAINVSFLVSLLLILFYIPIFLSHKKLIN